MITRQLSTDDTESDIFLLRAAYSKPDEPNSTATRRFEGLVPRFSANFAGYIIIAILNIALWALVLTRRQASCGSSITPVLNYTKLSIETQNIQANLFPRSSNALAFAAAPPSKEVDEAWHNVSRNMIIGLTRSDLARLGKDSHTAVSFNPEWDIPGSEHLYLGVLDVFHQVHCLNMLRQNLIINYDYYWGKAYGFRPEAFRERHLSHCTSILLQNIMCHADTEVVTHVWRQGSRVPWPDFGVKKQCRDFGALIKFRDTMDVENSWDKFRLYTKPSSDAVVLPEEDGLAELRASADEFRNGEYYKDLHIKGCNS